MRNARILGLALLAMLSMSAVMAVSASADTLTTTGYPALLTGTADEGFVDTLTTTAGAVKCPNTNYDATISGPVATAGMISVTPTHPAEGCTLFGFPGGIDDKSCILQLKILAGTAGTLNLACTTPGDELTATAGSGATSKCTVHIKPQTDIPGTIKIKNIAGGATLEANLTGIHYTHTAGTGVGACASGTGTNGALSVKAVFTAEKEGGGSTTMALE